VSRRIEDPHILEDIAAGKTATSKAALSQLPPGLHLSSSLERLSPC